MSRGGVHTRELDQTPSWAVALVSAIIIVLSIILEKVLHHVGEYFAERRKRHLYEALEKVKGELMVLGFISLLLTFGQSYIVQVCIPLEVADAMLPCPFHHHHAPLHESSNKPSFHKPPSKPGGSGNQEHRRRLLWTERRFLSGGAPPPRCQEGYEPLISLNGLHQLHIFIFFLAVFHIVFSAITMILGRLKIRGWKDWERETQSKDFQYTHGAFLHHTKLLPFVNEFEFGDPIKSLSTHADPSRFRLTHETSFVRSHTSCWTKNPFSFNIVCFFQQFFKSVRKSDYLTLRHGFVTVHLAPGSRFDFQKYIKRSMEDDFKVVVGISPLLWVSVVVYFLINVSGWQTLFWISVMPLCVILAVGTKLQAIITQMAIEITERHAVIQGIPLVQVSDSHFWFHWPRLMLYLIHFTLFQNAFQITYFLWIWYEFGLHSCFNQNPTLAYARLVMGVVVQFMCSYITLPLYALVTQMGSTMKKSIFDEETSKALKNWRRKAGKKRPDGIVAPVKVLGGSPGAVPMSNPFMPAKTVEVVVPTSEPATVIADMDGGDEESRTREEQMQYEEQQWATESNTTYANIDLLSGP